ncbi:MAG: cytochrome c biogenesis protein CcdA, partial [Candidatus Woesearchaeota archaeon]|nr:cytochrome c biogenesis protein CcdA [Candidatus Woesearchaeota archaeon]
MNVKVVLFLIITLLVASSITANAVELPLGIQKLIAYQTDIATGLTFLVAFIAGFISFTSPCGVAVIPAFLSVVFKDKNSSKRMTAMFSLGLITAFAILGIIAGLVSNIFDQFKILIAVISGVFLIVFGIMTLLNKNMGKTCTTTSLHSNNTSTGVYFLGMTLGLGWTPCIGAVLSGIFFLAI